MASNVWKGHLTFGLVSLPIRLFVAARGETISFNQLHKTDNSRVKQVLYCQAEDKPISRDEIVKGYEYEKGKYVVIDEEDLKKAAPTTAKAMEILEFVKGDEVDPVFLESSYYVAPEEAGQKAYALLYEALKKTGYVGVAKIAMHNREHIVILRPGRKGILLHTMYFRDEVREADEFQTSTSTIQDKEVELATMLINSLAAAFEPEKYVDNYRENVKAMIQAKVEGHEAVEAPSTERKAPVIDIMEALRMSLAEGKKPPQSVAHANAHPSAAKPKRGRKNA
jgi:DNA end-binding protein Ku